MPLISVVTPVYKAESILPALYQRLKTSLETITKDFEIIFVNDDSPQNDWNVICSLASADSRVKGINLSRNFGQHHAITAGLDHAAGDWTVVMDCDLQDQPEEIPRLYAKGLEGYDIVFARRFRGKVSLFKRCTSYVFYRIYESLIGERMDGGIANFSIISRKVLISMRKLHEHSRTYSLFLRWVGFKSASIDVEHAERFEGKTSYTLRRLLNLALDSIVAQSNKPLRFSIGIGFAMSAISLAFMVYLFVRYFFVGIGVEGWTSVMVSIWFIGGLLFVILGILGLYIGKTYDEAKNRPLYLVMDTVGFEDGD